MWTGTSVLLKSISRKYYTWVNGNIVPQNTQVELAQNDMITFGAHIESDNIKVIVECTDSPASVGTVSQPIRPVENCFEVPKTFITYSRTSRVLLAQFNMSTVPDCQRDDYLGKQWLSTAIATLIKMSYVPFSEWNADHMNDILYNGDDLYSEIVDNMSQKNRSPPDSGALNVSDVTYLQNALPLFDDIFHFRCRSEPCVEGYTHANENEMMETNATDLPLVDGIEFFFQRNKHGILNLENETLPISKIDQKF